MCDNEPSLNAAAHVWFRGLALHPEAHLGSDDVQVARARSPVILPHTINVKREMLVEGMADAGGEPVPHPTV